MEYTQKLIQFCSNLSFHALPEEVQSKAKLCFLDYVANIYGSLELDAVRSSIEFVRSLGGPEAATALACGFKTGLQNAAFINGVTAEAIEAQDGLRFGGNHPGTAVIPASLVMTEHLKLPGERLIEAIVAGYEVASRAAAAMHPYHTLSGFLPTGTCGTLGAAVAVSKLMGHGYPEMQNAMGNAGYILPISMAEQLMGGYTIKIVQGGQAASAGIMAAGLAGKGITGSPFVLEGTELKGGITQITMKADAKPERITEKLGEYYSITDIYFKPYTACRHTHGAAQATLALKQENGLTPDEVDSVTVFTYGVAALAVGKGVPDGGSFVSAQFSIPHVVAACILDGALGPAQLTERRIADPAIIAFTKKVTVKIDDDLNKMYPDKTASRVEIVLKNGKRLTRQVDIPKGDPRDPMDAEDLARKVRFFASNRKLKNPDRMIELILNLEKADNMDELVSLI
jgi:2-methylcitrate dehydratase PrpD